MRDYSRTLFSFRDWAIKCALGLLFAVVVSGCHSVKTSEPPRTAVEQLLLSTAANGAMRTVDFSWLEGRKVFVEDKYFESYDKGFAVGVIRERLSASGALLVRTNDKADVIVEIRSGALSVHSSQTLFGLPTLGLPIPLAGPVQTPELAIYKSQLSDSIAKFALFAYERETGKYIHASAPMLGHAHYHLYSV